jgi:hypothetical protein
MSIKGLYRNICSLINVSCFRTLLFNFKHLPFNQAVKMPILERSLLVKGIALMSMLY